MMRPCLLLALLVAAGPATAAAAIVVERPEIRPTMGGQGTAAAYMILRNTGPSADRLLGASCTCAAEVTPHRTVTAGGISRMESEAAVPLAVGASVAFDARGRHLMLTGLKGPIRAGAKVPVVLTFEKAGKVAATFTATDLAGMAGMTGSAHQHAH